MRIFEIHRVAQEDHGSSDCSPWLSSPWVEDQDSIITNEALDQQFGPLDAESVDDVLEKSEQVHVALLALTESESFDIVLGAAPSGLKALVPDQCELQDRPAGLAKWDELVRRHERSKSSGTTTTALDEDIKTAALEALVPSELNQHLAMNRARLITNEQVPSEIQAYTEARRRQFAFKTVATQSTSDPMEVDSFGKGGKKGKKGKKGNGDGKSVKKAEAEFESKQRTLFVGTAV